MNAIVSEVVENSPAAKENIKAGHIILEINGIIPRDIIDYQITIEEPELDLLVEQRGCRKRIRLQQKQHEPVGLKFTSSIFDKLKRCRNNCVFCFLDQLPKGLRSSLYVRDDDFRLSFLYGNFITLTNLEEDDVKRIIAQKLSPLYVSLHSTNQEVRKKLLRPAKSKDRALFYLDTLLKSGIEVHLQIVICPGINDGKDLEITLRVLESDFPLVKSVGIIPVGLTKHRANLFPLQPIRREECHKLIRQLEKLQKNYRRNRGTSWIFLADEFYLQAGIALPSFEHYEDFSQLENGIGITRMFVQSVEDNLKLAPNLFDPDDTFIVVTGKLAAPILKETFHQIQIKMGGVFKVQAIINSFFGDDTTIAGLITAKDIIDFTKKNSMSGTMLIPEVMLNSEDRFLDDVSWDQLVSVLQIPVEKMPVDGRLLIDKLMVKGGISS